MKVKKKYRLLLEGGSGRIGNKIICQRNGKTYARKAPRKGYNKVPTVKQAAVRERFAEAFRFAQSVINDPELKAHYEIKAANKCSAYTKAIATYLASHPVYLPETPIP